MVKNEIFYSLSKYEIQAIKESITTKVSSQYLHITITFNPIEINKIYKLLSNLYTINDKDAIEEGKNVIVIDDLLATGGTVAAACKLLQKAGGNVKAAAFVIELTDLNGREKLPKDVEVVSMISY